MSKKEDALKIATDLTFKEALKFETVLPSLYEEMFKEKCKTLGIEPEDNIDMATSGALAKFKSYEDSLKHGTDKLQDGVEQAVIAVEQKDTATLNKVKDDMQKLKNELNQLKGKLYQDEMTGLYNRRWFLEKYTKDGKFKTKGIFVFVDLNKFKYINDTFGHLIGVKVLEFFGKVLIKYKERSIGIRYAGDEFMMLFENTDLEMSKKIVTAIKAMIAKKVFKVSGKEFKVSFSSGYAKFDVGSEIVKVLEVADADMYEEKERSRGAR